MLRQAGQRLVVERANSTLIDIPVFQLSAIFVYGAIRVTPHAIRLCFEKGIALNFLSRTGSFRGRLTPAQVSTAPLRLLQYERTQDPVFCLAFARAIVTAKVESSLAWMESRRRSGSSTFNPDRAAQLRTLVEQIRAAPSIDSLRGLEGTAARLHFAMFRRANKSNLSFTTRERFSPEPINALLNFAYTLLLREWESLILGAGLDVSLGFYHCLEGARPSLACDLMEEFRAALVDPLVLRLVNKRILQASDFTLRGPSPRPFLSSEGQRRFLAFYDTEASRLRRLYFHQLQRLIAAMKDPVKGYLGHLHPPTSSSPEDVCDI